MTVVGYAFEEAWSACGGRADRRWCRSARSRSRSLTLGGFLLVSVNVQRVLDQWLQAAEMSVYLHDTHREADRVRARAVPQGAAGGGGGRVRVASERALERFRADFPELRDVTTGVGENPFPSALEVRLRTENAGDAAADALARDVAGEPGVGDVRYDRQWLARLVAW